MLFNSIDFAVFLPVVFAIYWFVFNKNLKLQNAFIVFASYVFYGWWDWRFLTLIFASTLIDYFSGLAIYETSSLVRRKRFLFLSLISNLGLLSAFKYFNFFIENFTLAFSFFGFEVSQKSISIILPVGISFYTFQTLSYTIDVYRKKLKPTNDFISFAAFVSFFPQLVAGPIERATNLLPQFYQKRTFDYSQAVDGLRQILWGLFKKIVVADNCAKYADLIFNNSEQYSGVTLWFGALFFAFQIYGDFSGYSDIAIGTARLFGFNLRMNFAFPYFSRDIAEFWRRWHISLSTWFRDYVYIPLGGSKAGNWKITRNVFIVFLVSGFWHGANWTFIVWGLINAIYFLPLLIMGKNRENIDMVAQGKFFPKLSDVGKILLTFNLTLVAWVFFRAETLHHAYNYTISLLHGVFMKNSYVESLNLFYWEIGWTLPFVMVMFVFLEWIGRNGSFALEELGNKWPRFFRWLFYSFLILLIILVGGEEQQFIYFQF